MDAKQPAIAGSPYGAYLGDLARGGTTWQVYLDTRPEGSLVAGRVHFVAGDTVRTTAWIFLEWSEADAARRFNEFSPIELWKILESLG